MAKYKVVHYINQFFAGMGGEDTANVGLSVEEKVIGPGLAIQKALGDDFEIVATIICGDNTIAENTEEILEEFGKIITKYEADIFIAGPGFNAGRYGIGCGASVAYVTETLKIPAVTGLYAENPGTDLYKDRGYILQTKNSAAGMRRFVPVLAKFVRRLAEGDAIADGKKEGYHGSGKAPEIDYSTHASKRGIDMLLKKYYGESFSTEVKMPNHEEIPLPTLDKPLSEVKIAFVTDGGLVPKGNPDNMVPTNSVEFRKYSIGSGERLSSDEYEVSHQGYNNAFVLEDPNRLIPIDAALNLKKKGMIGDLLDYYYTTAGVMTPMERGKKFGSDIASDLRDHNVDAVVLTST